MVKVRTATAIGSLALLLVQAPITRAQNWYRPDGDAYPGNRPAVSSVAQYPATMPGSPRATGWQTTAAPTWQGAVDASRSTQAPTAAPTYQPQQTAAQTPRYPQYPPAVPTYVASRPQDTPPPSSQPQPLPAPANNAIGYVPGNYTSNMGTPQPDTRQPASVACGPGGNCAPSGYHPATAYHDPVAGWGTGGGACGTGACADGVGAFGATDQPICHGLFFRWDRLYFTLSEPTVATVGDPMQAGVYQSNGVPYPFINSIDTGFIDGDADFGDRIEFGVIDPQQRNGWVASVLMLDRRQSLSAVGGTMLFNDPDGMLLGFQDSDNDGIDDDINGNAIYGRHGQDLMPLDGVIDGPAPQDNGDLVTWVPIFGELEASSYTDISGFELMYVRGLGNCGMNNCGVNWLFGVRYLDIDDDFHLLGRGGLYDETEIRSSTNNLIIGPQMGVVMARAIGPWSLSGEFRYMPGVNIIEGRQRGIIASNAEQTIADLGTSANRPINLTANAVSNTFDDETFSSVLEWRVDASYSVTQWMSVRAGYTGLFMSEVLRGAGNLNYTLPSFGFSSTDGEDVSMHALTLGLEFYR